MKKIFTIFSLAILSLGMAACNNSHEKTIANLKAAIDGETEATAKYAAYAQQADAEGYGQIATMFRATSAAENLHIRNHTAVLESLGVTDYVPAVPQITVGTTAENLRSAVEGEKYENDQMYPAFIKDAEKENVPDAITSFTYARDAEMGHSVLYAQALESLETPGAIATIYYVCPQCGNTYAGEAEEICSLCGAPVDTFIVFETSVPVTETASEEIAAETTPDTLS